MSYSPLCKNVISKNAPSPTPRSAPAKELASETDLPRPQSAPATPLNKPEYASGGVCPILAFQSLALRVPTLTLDHDLISRKAAVPRPASM